LLLTKGHIKQFAIAYFLFALLNYLWLLINGQLFSSILPVFFQNNLDVTKNLIMLSGLQHLLIQSQVVRVLFDMLYIFMPFLLCILCYKEKKYLPVVALLTSLFNIVFATYYSSMSYMTIGMFQAWIFVPLVLCCTSEKGFYYNLHTVRLIFIVIFFSAALWKIKAGGAFDKEQMSSIFLRQHADYLVSNGNAFYTKFIYFFVKNPIIAQLLYWFGFIGELIFAIGFFTKKFDKFLIGILVLFVICDYVFMKINLFCWVPFALCFYFSRYSLKH
jgi:hypothetical protein